MDIKGTDYDNWAEWDVANPGADEAARLTVLHAFIVAAANEHIHRGDVTAEWVNKKLGRLGITQRIRTESHYTVQADVTGVVAIGVYAHSRTEALDNIARRLAGAGSFAVGSVTATSDPIITAGPEDAPTAPDPDAPTTVADTLTKLREVLLLGNIAGPRWQCDSGTNRVLDSFGLDRLPERKSFRVSRPVTADMVTTVVAYDEESAQRVAGWRWDNDRAGYTANNIGEVSTDEVDVSPVVSVV